MPITRRRLVAAAAGFMVAATGAGAGAAAGVAANQAEAWGSGAAATDPLVSELLRKGGRWEFGRVGGGKLCDVVLTQAKGRHGFVLRACHANESFWRIEKGKLLFVSANGAPTTRFTRAQANAWRGPYLGTKEIPAQGIVHYLKR